MNFTHSRNGSLAGDAAPPPRSNAKNRDEGVAAPVNVGRKCLTALLEKSIEQPPIALGRPAAAFFAFEELLDAPFPRLRQFLGRCEIRAVLPHQFRPDPRTRHGDHAKGALQQTQPDDHHLTDVDVAAGFGREFMDGHAASPARVRGQAPASKDPDRPQPFVEAGGRIGGGFGQGEVCGRGRPQAVESL